MMKLISVLLVLAVPAIAFLIRNYDRISGKVAARVSYLLLSFLVVISAMFPGLVGDLAHAVGVGRGADLVFYATTISLITLAGIMIVKVRSLELRIAKLSREIALKDFETKQNSEGG